jgi:vancomycin resistance protein YoaR
MTDELMTAPATDAAMAPVVLPRRRTWARFLVAFLIGLIAATAIGAGALYAFDRQYEGKILPGVRVGGVDVSGLTPSEARDRLGEAFASFGRGRAILTSGELEMAIDYEDIGRQPDLDAMVTEAMAVGRSGNAVERAILDARTAIKGVDLEPRVRFDPARLARAVNIHARGLRIEPVNASVTTSKEGFAVVEDVFGRQADRAPATDFLMLALAATDAPNVTTAEAAAARKTAELIALDIAITEGKETWTIPAATVRSWITFKPSTDGGYEPRIEHDALDTALAAIAKEVVRKPKNASFTTSGSKITGVTAAQNGRVLDVTTTATRVGELLAKATVEPALTITPPALTTEAAKAAISKMQRISTWTTYFPISERNNYGANIWIPALDIDGYVVGPGEVFDFWKAVGPVTRERGYGDGGAIINGKTEPQGALAGGICSCSTTLFNAALRAGFDMGARRNHFYYIDRYPIGLDATVFKSGSGSVQTMSFTNDTAYPVLIRGYKIRKGSSGYVRFDIYSVPTGRKIVIGNPTIKNVRRATDTIQYTTSLAPGARKRIEYPVDGKDVWRTVTVLDATGKVVHKTTYYSHYARITGVTLVGK